MIKSALKEQNFRWKNIVNERGRRGEVMGVNRAEVDTVRKDEDPELEPVLLNMALSLVVGAEPGAPVLPPKAGSVYGLEALQCMASAQLKLKLKEESKQEDEDIEELKEPAETFMGQLHDKALETKFKLPASKVLVSQEREEVAQLFAKNKVGLEVVDGGSRALGIVCSLSSRWQSYEVVNMKGQNYLRLFHFTVLAAAGAKDGEFYLLETDDDQVKFAVIPMRTSHTGKPLAETVRDIFAVSGSE